MKSILVDQSPQGETTPSGLRPLPLSGRQHFSNGLFLSIYRVIKKFDNDPYKN
jgi:hypothetical protein